MTRVEGGSPQGGTAKSRERAEKAARKVQARIEGAGGGDEITWKGATFRLRETELPGVTHLIIGQIASGKFDENAVDGIRRILKKSLRGPSGPQPGDPGFDAAAWDRGDFQKFMDHADDTDASMEEILEAVNMILEAFAARPTGRPPASSNGQPRTTANSTASSSGRAGPGSSG